MTDITMAEKIFELAVADLLLTIFIGMVFIAYGAVTVVLKFKPARAALEQFMGGEIE